jgi:hypothetical protein
LLAAGFFAFTIGADMQRHTLRPFFMVESATLSNHPPPAKLAESSLAIRRSTHFEPVKTTNQISGALQ